jgi:hypothetical protein
MQGSLEEKKRRCSSYSKYFSKNIIIKLTCRV